jgi:hypothetical protein
MNNHRNSLPILLADSVNFVLVIINNIISLFKLLACLLAAMWELVQLQIEEA